MKVIYYTRPSFLDLALSYVHALSNLVELHLLIELSPQGWESSLFDISPQEIPAGIVDGRKVFRSCFPEKLQRYWQDCASFNLVVHDSPKSLNPASWKTAQKAIKFCQNIESDIIHFDGLGLRTQLIIWRFRRIPIICSIHDPEQHSGEKSWRSQLVRWLSFPFVNKFVLHNNNKEMANSFIDRYRLSQSQICFQPLGIYDIYKEWIGNPVAQDEKTILFFGRISKYKGIEVLYRAMPLVAEKIPGVRFIIAGRPNPDYCLPELPLLKGNAKVEVVEGYIRNPQLVRMFMEATVVACPYIDATQSGVVLTAYAFRRPVVATNIGGLPEYVKNEITGLLVDPDDHDQLADALIRILENRNLRMKLEEGIEYMACKDFNWEEITKKAVALYSQCLNSD